MLVLDGCIATQYDTLRHRGAELFGVGTEVIASSRPEKSTSVPECLGVS